MEVASYKGELNFLINRYEELLKENKIRPIYSNEFRNTTGRILIQFLIDIGYSPNQIIDKFDTDDPSSKERLKINIFKDITFPEKFRDIKLPSSIERVLDSAFADSNIRSVEMKSVKYISEKAFQNCKDLVEITLSDNIELISDFAFSHCDNLKSVIYYGTQQSWEDKFGKRSICEASYPTIVFMKK